MTLLTRVAASVFATCPQAIGVYLGHAGLVVQAPVFQSFAESAGYPLYTWIDFRAGSLPSGKSSGFNGSGAVLLPTAIRRSPSFGRSRAASVCAKAKRGANAKHRPSSIAARRPIRRPV